MLLAGFALRLILVDRFPFREDEAIYSYWALYGWRVDPFFLHVWPDKPPLFLWSLASAFQVWGTSPAAARMLNVAFSVLTIAVAGAVARRWWGAAAGAAAALLMALSPFAISFAPTGYTDSLLLLAGALALASAAAGRPLWSGLWLGAAIMTKQQGLLFVPLIAGALVGRWAEKALAAVERGTPPEPAGAVSHALSPGAGRALAAAGLRLLLGALLVLLPILWWDSRRWSVAPSPWDLGAQHAGAVLAVAAGQWAARVAAWLGQAWYLGATWPAWLFYAALLSGAVILAAAGRAGFKPIWPVVLLAVWAAAFLAFHVMTSVQVWDRYLLPLVLPLSLIGGWAAGIWLLAWRSVAQSGAPAPPAARRWRLAAAAIMILAGAVALLPPAAGAATGAYPIGADHGDLEGLDAAFGLVAAQAADPPTPRTVRTVVYHREVGWQAQFYLFDQLQQGQVELRYFPHAVYLADSAAKLPHLRRLLVTPDWTPVHDTAVQLAARGLQLRLLGRPGRFLVYAIEEAPGPAATQADQAAAGSSWRACRETPAPNWPVSGPPAMMCTQ